MTATYTSFGVDEGADKQLLTLERGDVHAQGVFLKETGIPTYFARFQNVSIATANDHVIFVQGDGTNYTLVNRIWITQFGFATARARASLEIVRTSTAGSGGTVIAARPLYASDIDPYSGTVQTLPSSKGTESNSLVFLPLWLAQSADNTMDNRGVEWARGPYTRPIVIGTATTSGIALKVNAAYAGATISGVIELSLIAEA